MGTSDSKQGGFTVTDRRSFAGTEPAPASAKEGQVAPAAQQEGDGEGGGDDAEGDMAAGERGAADASSFPAVDFHTFVLSLGSSALLHLGELEHPEGGEVEKDLPLAKHTIDILSMLEQKTKGNLTSAEEKLIESLLYDLRLRYVNASK
jgi:hypothetical protein